MLFWVAHFRESPWRNGLAHWTSNSKVVGSSPTGDVFFFSFSFFFPFSNHFFFFPNLKELIIIKRNASKNE